jgi:hypothetical protein
MSSGKHLIFIAVVGLLLGYAATAAADLPGPYNVGYDVLETPTDPNSDVLFEVTLELEAVEAGKDNDIGWLIRNVLITQFDQSGQPRAVWLEELPDVPTGDGLWWVDHADPLNPQAEEFDDTPALSGVASAYQGGSADLIYDFDGEVYQQPPPYLPVSSSTYMFKLDGEDEPEDDGEDEPVPIEPVDVPV